MSRVRSLECWATSPSNGSRPPATPSGFSLPAQGTKIRCNELIHKVGPPGGENLTYFRGDATRKLIVEKLDYVEDRPEGPDGPVRRKVQSVTRIWTIDATLVDNGGGMEASNLFAHGPGLLETRPAGAQADSPLKDVPPDRTVAWQDLLVVKNVLGPDRTISQRELVLKGRPRITDRLQASSLDAEDTVVVWLEPRPATGPAASAGGQAAEKTSPQAGGFQIKRLLALGNAHLVAPSKNLTARDRLDTDFEEAAGPLSKGPSSSQTAAQGAPGAARSLTNPAG